MLLPFVLASLVGRFSFSAPATPAFRLFPALSQACGVPLETDERLSREVLLVQVKDASLADLMKRIAQATGGEWEKGDDGYRLTLVKAEDAKERREEARERGEAWLRPVRQRTQARGGQPANRNLSATDQILLNLSPDTLGGLGFKERVVFSTNPTAMQRLLPASVLSGIDLSKLQSYATNRYVNGQPVARPSGPAASAQFTIQAQNDDTYVSCLLSTADAQGRTLGSEYGNLYRFDDPTPKVAPVKPPRPEAVVTGTPEERGRAAALARLGTASEGFGGMSAEDQEPTVMYSDADLAAPPTVGAMPELLRPEETDPLALTAGPLLAALADGEGTNLVAAIPDGAFLPASQLLARKEVRVAELLGRARGELGVAVLFEPGWTVVSPREMARTRDRRLDRAALGTALRALARDHDLSLDAQAAYAVAEPLVPARETFEATLFSAVDGAFGKRIAASCGSGERQTLRLYAAVGRVGKGPQAFGSLPSAAQEVLRDMAFNGVSGPRFVASPGAGPDFGMNYRGPFASPDSISMERTVFWSGGIPLGAVLTVAEETEPSMFGLAPNGVRAKMSEHSSGYGMRGDDRGGFITSTTHPRLEKYQRGTVRHLRFTLRGAPSVELTRSLESSSLDPNAPILDYADLPESLRKQIESVQEGVRRMREQSQSPPTNARP